MNAVSDDDHSPREWCLQIRPHQLKFFASRFPPLKASEEEAFEP